MDEKRCAGCHEDKALNQFGNDAGRKDGKQIYCKLCRRRKYAKLRGEGKIVRDGVVVRTPPKTIVCAQCENEFRPRHGKQRFCCRSCAAQDRNRKVREGRKAGTIPMPSPRKRLPAHRRPCEQCGQEFDPWTTWAKYCSFVCKSTASMGERKVVGDGYVRIRVPPETPGAYRSGWMLEHRYVMQEHLGRPLLPEETVHHIDGDKGNNVIGNLELWSTRHPKGQRVEDLVEFAREVLDLYTSDGLALAGVSR